MNQNIISKSNSTQNTTSRRRARSRALRYLSGFASQVRDPEEATELERIAAFIREREASDEIEASNAG